MDQRRLAAITQHPRIESTEELARRRATALEHRLGTNENLFPFPQRVQDRLMQALDKMRLYCDPESHALRKRLSQVLQVPAQSLHVSSGIDTLLADTAIAFVESGDVVVMTEGTYVTMSIVATRQGAEVRCLPYCDGRAPIRAMAELIARIRPRLAYLVNPDNPAGCVYSTEEIHLLLDAAAGHTVIALDEAYADFVQPGELLPYGNNIYPNLFRYRTFSKLYGLAGLKIGYVVGHPDNVEILSRISLRYGVGRFAQEAALLSLEDDELQGEVLRAYDGERERLTRGLADIRISIRPCATNFMLAHLGSQQRRDAAIAFLFSNGLLTRPTPGRGHETLMRITIGSERENRRLLELMHEFVASERPLSVAGVA